MKSLSYDTADDLRRQAALLRQAAQFAESREAYQRDMAHAAKLQAEAARLEPLERKQGAHVMISAAEREAARQQKMRSALDKMEAFFSPGGNK